MRCAAGVLLNLKNSFDRGKKNVGSSIHGGVQTISVYRGGEERAEVKQNKNAVYNRRAEDFSVRDDECLPVKKIIRYRYVDVSDVGRRRR